MLDARFEGRAQHIAASLGARSDHPVSMAVANAAVDKKQAWRAVDNFTALAGRGVRGEIDGTLYHLGNHRLVEELGLCSPELEEKLFALEQQGKTVILLCDSAGPMALFAVADTVKASSREAIAELHALGIKTLMLTGDNPHTAKAIAAQVGIDEAQFFDEGLIDVCNQLANNGIRVIVAGLDMDFRGNPFGPMPGLCAIADEVSKVHAICVKCGQLASFSHRTVKNDKQVLLGETAEYEPLCRECYLRAIKEDQQTASD